MSDPVAFCIEQIPNRKVAANTIYRDLSVVKLQLKDIILSRNLKLSYLT